MLLQLSNKSKIKFSDIAAKAKTLEELATKYLDNTISYIGEGKDCGRMLVFNDRYACQEYYISKGEFLQPHEHQHRVEIIVVISGKMKFDILDDHGNITDSRILWPEETIKFGPFVIHQATALEDTILNGITIPSDPGYPH